MQRLPTLTAGDSCWRLPLAESVAAGLAAAFVLEDCAERQRRLTALLAEDPATALWTACRADCAAVAQSPGVPSLAAWLAESGLIELQWTEAELREPVAAERDQKTRWAEWTAHAVALARSAKQLAPAEAGERAYLLGLLQGAPQWLASCGPQPPVSPGPGHGPGGLPAWLAASLPGLALPASDDPAFGAVARAADRMAGEAGMAGDGALQAERDHAAAVRHRWAATAGVASRLLPLLMHRLRRLQQLETEFQSVLEREKVEALYAFAYGASHEINNPLANISTRAQTLLREETDPERRRKLAVINSQAFRAHELIADLMLFARPPELQIARLDAMTLIDQVIAELAVDAEEQGTALVCMSPPGAVWLEADGRHLAVALSALCRNALEALQAGGRVELSAASVGDPTARAADCVQITVRDSGPGLSAEARRHVFDPYFSGREAGRGLGLGLSKCWRIVTEHGGRIEVHSPAAGGAAFTLHLPAHAVDRESAAE